MTATPNVGHVAPGASSLETATLNQAKVTAASAAATAGAATIVVLAMVVETAALPVVVGVAAAGGVGYLVYQHLKTEPSAGNPPPTAREISEVTDRANELRKQVSAVAGASLGTLAFSVATAAAGLSAWFALPIALGAAAISYYAAGSYLDTSGRPDAQAADIAAIRRSQEKIDDVSATVVATDTVVLAMTPPVRTLLANLPTCHSQPTFSMEQYLAQQQQDLFWKHGILPGGMAN